MLTVFELWDLPPTTDCLAPELIFFSKFLLATPKISEADYSSLSLGHVMANKSTSAINLCTCTSMSVCVCMRNRVSECGCIMLTFLFSILYLPGISFNLYNNPINSDFYWCYTLGIQWKSWDPEIPNDLFKFSHHTMPPLTVLYRIPSVGTIILLSVDHKHSLGPFMLQSCTLGHKRLKTALDRQ